MRLKVLLVDDEPFILQGLTVLIDWEGCGCEIVKTASNGLEALNYLKEHTVDLIIADIKMPVMTGLELLETIREESISDAYFIIISGYNDFKFAQKAIRYTCMDYILKPVQKESLLQLVKTVAHQKAISEEETSRGKKLERVYFTQNIRDLLRGRFNQQQLEHVRENLSLQGKIRYVHISLENIALREELGDDELIGLNKKLVDNVSAYLGKYATNYLINVIDEEEFDVGLIYFEQMAAKQDLTTDEYLRGLVGAAGVRLEVPVILLAGKEVDDIEKLSRSYSSACALRSFKGFRNEKSVYYYEEELQVNQSKVVLCKHILDRLIIAVEQNDTAEINRSIDDLYTEMQQKGMTKDLIAMNTNYLLFQLIHLAVEQDESVNQEEVMLYLSENVFEPGTSRGGRAHFRRFASEYAEYLIQLRKNVSRGVLLEIEKEVREHYADNLTLRELSKKYFVNSSYLGQIFRKKYGLSFKDYLSNYRVNEAALQLLKTDKKISQIAEDIGYHDTDYFISRFIEQKGCTPARYRKNAGMPDN